MLKWKIFSLKNKNHYIQYISNNTLDIHSVLHEIVLNNFSWVFMSTADMYMLENMWKLSIINRICYCFYKSNLSPLWIKISILFYKLHKFSKLHYSNAADLFFKKYIRLWGALNCKLHVIFSVGYLPFDCLDVFNSGKRRTGVYRIFPLQTYYRPIEVKCDMNLLGGGWTV